MSFKVSEHLTYRANIFNYDTKYFEEFSKTTNKIDFSVYNMNNHKYISDNYTKFQNHLNLPINEQLDNINSLVGLLNENKDEDDFPKIPIKKEAKVFVQVLLDIVNSSEKLFVINEEEYLQNQSKMDVASREVKKNLSNKILSNLINSLLLLDGIVMSNVELGAVFEFLGDNVGVKITDTLWNIMNDKTNSLGDIPREISSHLLSTIYVFSVKHEYSYKEFKSLIEWIIGFNHSRDRKRDCLLTTNLYIILSNEIGLNCYMTELKRALPDLTNILFKEKNINIIYETLFCLWAISSNPEYINIFESNQEGVLDKIIQTIKLNKVEKIIRIGTLLIKNLLVSETCVEFLVDWHFGRTINNLLSNKWSDESIKEELTHIAEFLEKNYKSLKSFEKYKKELDSGILKNGFLHTTDFWEDCYKDFEYKDFECINILCQILQAPIKKDFDIDQKCIACYDIGEFARMYPGGAGIVTHFGAKEALLKLIQHENMELKNKSLVCLQKIMMKSHKL